MAERVPSLAALEVLVECWPRADLQLRAEEVLQEEQAAELAATEQLGVDTKLAAEVAEVVEISGLQVGPEEMADNLAALEVAEERIRRPGTRGQAEPVVTVRPSSRPGEEKSC
jgi:hypothetical protein